jgi:hypothetical protein
MASTWHVLVWQCASELHRLPDRRQVPLAVPPRQFIPSSQSTPTSVQSSKVPPGTPVSDPDVSTTTKMLGW